MEKRAHELPRTVDALLAYIRNGGNPSYLFFWGHRASGGQTVGKWCLSQWWPVSFTGDGVRYPSAEHYMMAGKARLFGDDDMERRILAAPDPASAKKLGRAVRGFDVKVWEAHCYELVVAGNVAKFDQHPELRSFLLSIREDIIVEASPVDTIWGIGLAQDTAAAKDPARWRGRNLLGFALMETRMRLRDRKNE